MKIIFKMLIDWTFNISTFLYYIVVFNCECVFLCICVRACVYMFARTCVYVCLMFMDACLKLNVYVRVLNYSHY